MRLINSGSASAAQNMAVDETLFLFLRKGLSAPFIRFYQWTPFALSFGYFQPIDKILVLDRLQQSGVDAVRRMTGGKMVFHAKEITFSLGMPLSLIKQPFPAATTFLDFFRELMTPFVRGLQSFSLPAKFAQHPDGKPSDKLHCYSSSVGHSIFLGEKKLIGAAGIVKEDILAVHGSIPLEMEAPPEGIFQPGRNPHPELAIAMLHSELAPSRIPALLQRIADGFGSSFHQSVKDDTITPAESAIAQILQQEKYSDLFWQKNSEPLYEKTIASLLPLPRGLTPLNR